MWGSMLSKKALNKLTQLQRTSVSLIDQNMGTDEVFKKHGILEFEKLVLFEQIKIGYKLCHSLLPTSLAALLSYDHKGQTTSKSHRYYTRNKQIPNLPYVLNSKYKSSFLFRAVKEYSEIDDKLRSSRTLHSFARNCKKYLLQH